MIKNVMNGKRYIGQSIQAPEKRLQQHFNSAYDENRKSYMTCLSRGIRKYGKDAFVMGILADDVPEDDLDMVEAHYIDMYNTTDSTVGYNISDGYTDTENYKEKRKEMPEENYANNGEVVLDNISDEDVEAFLNNL
jgi:group I intron endonuclease